MMRKMMVAILLVLGMFGMKAFAQSAQNDDVIGKRMAELMKAPYLVRVSSSGQQKMPNGQMAPVFGHGSGFVYVNEAGQCGIYTNNHVLGSDSNRMVWVTAYGDVAQGKKFAANARIVARDPALDFGLVECPPEIKTSGVSASLGESRDIEVGLHVYAGGYPNGMHSVRDGHIIATTSNSGPFHFASDVHLQPGNSGGPMFAYVHDRPVIVGMNTAIGGAGQNESYTLNIEYIRRIIPMLWTGESVVLHGALNLWVEDPEDAHPELFQRLAHLDYPPTGNGLIVFGVEAGGSVDRAGIKVGDVITGLAYNGKPILFKNVREFIATVVFLHPDEKVTLVGLHEGVPFEKIVVLEDLPSMWQ